MVPADALLAQTYRILHRSQQLREEFEEIESGFEETEIEVPENLRDRVCAILKEHDDLRWDDAIQMALDETQLDHKKKSGDF